MRKRALISVYDKTDILIFAQFLQENNVEIISTSGTYKYLKENGIEVIDVSSVTNFKEILDGRIKTLHPNIHGGILAIRNNPDHMKTLKENGIQTIDYVVINLYPFFEEVQTDKTLEEKVEFIDIGGPTMLRSAAKSFEDVVVVCDPSDYKNIINEMKETEEISINTRKTLAAKVFNLTSAYDASISSYLLEGNKEMKFPKYLNASYELNMNLRYGENPHQDAAYYVSTTTNGSMKDFDQLNGKELSFNNIRDMDIAWKVVNEFDEISCCAVKHSTPCGVAISNESIKDAYVKAYNADSVSIFGGIVALNREVDEDTANELVKIFLEIVIAPSFTEKALKILNAKKNLRVIRCSIAKPQDKYEYVKVDGGLLVQETNLTLLDNINVVTEVESTDEELKSMILGMKVVKHVKSNAIVVVNGDAITGVGTGQTNRIESTIHALETARGATVLASDAFFPFADCVEVAAKNGIKAIIQPGGSIRDQESIDACNKYGISMVFTGIRHFKH